MRTTPLRLAILALLAACSSSTEPEPEPEPEPIGGDGISGYFVANERPTVGLFLYDEKRGGPEQFFVSQNVTTPGGFPAIIYWWGTYIESGNTLQFTLFQATVEGAPNLSAASWTTRPSGINATVAGLGRLTLARTADKAPGDK